MNESNQSDEARRLATLRNYEVLDTPPDPAFDDITMLAARICEVPMALVSLVDDCRQWFKSRQGVQATETPRNISFCARAIGQPGELLVVEDARLDPRFVENPLVTGEPHVRFYAGAPLIAPDGSALGTLCVMDHQPRVLTPPQRDALRALGRRVIAQLELQRVMRQLTVTAEETKKMLLTGERSRRALLSVLEDEKQAGLQLRESEERFRQLAENIDEVFWIRDVATSSVVYVSAAFEKIWGRPREYLYRSVLTWSDSLHADDRERVLAAAREKQALGTYDETYRILRPDGSLRWIRDKAFPVKLADGTVHRIVGVAEDITEARLMEEKFLRAQRLEAVGTLASGVAHDMNNILAPMLMAAGLLKDKLHDRHDQEILLMVEQSAQRGAGIISQLLNFSRGADGVRCSVTLGHLIKEMSHLMQETFPKNIVLRTVVEKSLASVVADATQLHQVLMNLCVNARDAMPDGGELSVEARNVQLSEEEARWHAPAPAGTYAEITVSDTGHGIPAEVMEHIFEPFFTTKEAGKGTGLGLATVAGIVKSHHGILTVESEPGRGSRFRILLPAETVAAAPAPAEPAPAGALAGRNQLILVVDDERPIREALRAVLEKQRYRVLLAASGEEAIRLFVPQRQAIRLVFTDMMMPGMGGLSLIRSLRVLEPNLPIIACSGLALEQNQAGLEALAVAETLAKPFTPIQALEAIGRLLPV